MTERVVTFGPRSAITGVLSTPDAGSREEKPALLMWNVGANPRVGPYRFSVDMARALSRAGFTTLRFDASGLGDSSARHGASSDRESVDLDLSDAMEMLTRRVGIERFVLLGFCSSVDATHRVAVRDPRVVGTVHIEGYAFRTPKFQVRVPLRALSRFRWERRALLKLDRARARLKRQPDPQPPPPVYKRDYPDWSSFARELAGLGQRGVAMLFVYVGIDTHYNYKRQFWDMFGTPELNRAQVEVEYYAEADHTFVGVRSRRELIERVVRFMRQRFA